MLNICHPTILPILLLCMHQLLNEMITNIIEIKFYQGLIRHNAARLNFNLISASEKQHLPLLLCMHHLLNEMIGNIIGIIFLLMFN